MPLPGARSTPFGVARRLVLASLGWFSISFTRRIHRAAIPFTRRTTSAVSAANECEGITCLWQVTRNDSDEAERSERSPSGVVSVANGEELAAAGGQVSGEAAPASGSAPQTDQPPPSARGSGGRARRPPDPLAGGGGRSGCKALPLAGAAPPLTCRAAPVNSSSFASLTTPRGLRSLRSASSLPFLVTCQRQVIPSHSFAALTALAVRRVKGDVALLICRVNGIAALFVRRVSSSADRPMPCLCLPPARPPEGHWRAHPAAAPCRRQAENR